MGFLKRKDSTTGKDASNVDKKNENLSIAFMRDGRDNEEENNAEMNRDYYDHDQATLQMFFDLEKGTYEDVKWLGDGKKYQNGLVTVTSGNLKDSNFQCRKLVTEMDVPVERLAVFLSAPDRLLEFDELVLSADIIQQNVPHKPNKSALKYMISKPVGFVVSSRDCVFTTSCHVVKEERDVEEEKKEDYEEDLDKCQDNETIVVCSRVVDHEDFPPKSGYVRGRCTFSGYILRKIEDNRTSVTLMFHTDLGGYIPSKVINTLGISAPIKVWTTSAESMKLNTNNT